MVQAESFSGRAASPWGRRWTGLGDALLSIPEHPGARRSPTPGPRPGGGSGKEGVAGGAWKGHRGLSASLPLPRGACALGEGGSQAEAAFSPCARAPGLLPARVPLSRVSGGLACRCPASQEAFPEGHCISRVTVLGVPPPASPGSAPSRRARWKTTLRGSHRRCDLSLPARK